MLLNRPCGGLVGGGHSAHDSTKKFESTMILLLNHVIIRSSLEFDEK